jgi:cytidylate kinase
MIVAIDGPAGSGKSTVARGVAGALGFSYLDSGAMYRCVALASLEDPARGAAEHAAAVEISLGDRVLLAGRDVTHAIRSPTVSAQASVVAADPAVRAALVARQRKLLGSGSWVAEGRDIGTVVAPEAALKVFLDASDAERAARRAHELGADPAEVAAELRARDSRDRDREHSPLEAAPDAVVLDSSGLDAGEVVARIVALARAADAGGGGEDVKR